MNLISEPFIINIYVKQLSNMWEYRKKKSEKTAECVKRKNIKKFEKENFSIKVK